MGPANSLGASWKPHLETHWAKAMHSYQVCCPRKQGGGPPCRPALAEGLRARGNPEKPEGPYPGAALSPAPRQVAAQVMARNIGAACEVPPQLKAPEVAGRVGARGVIPATDQAWSWVGRAQLGVAQVASQLEDAMPRSPVPAQVTARVTRRGVKRVTPQGTRVWAQVSAQVGTHAGRGHRCLALRDRVVWGAAWVLPGRPAPTGGLAHCRPGTHCQGRVLSGSTLPPGGKSPSWRENSGKQHLGETSMGHGWHCQPPTSAWCLQKKRFSRLLS